MVYVDKIIDYGIKGKWAHLWADTIEELHFFAYRLSMKKEWFQNHNRHPHYDLRPSKHKLAIKLGALVYSYRKYLREKSKHG
jgi:hypothetical protein